MMREIYLQVCGQSSIPPSQSIMHKMREDDLQSAVAICVRELTKQRSTAESRTLPHILSRVRQDVTSHK